jgi:hypothetical protein
VLLFISLQSVDFVLKALNVVHRALEDRALVRLSNVEILNDVVEKLISFWQKCAQLLDSVVDVKTSSAFDCKKLR